MQQTIRHILSDSGVTYSIETYEYNPHGSSIGIQAAQSMGQDENSVAKTLIIEVDKKSPVCIVLPVHKKVDMDAAAALLMGKKARMMNADKSTKLTGFVSGGTSPLGVFNLMPVFLAEELMKLDALYVNAGDRGLVVRLSPSDLLKITGAKAAAISLELE
ncbi:YbaK/EbsC family protein [Vibrio porteresiae]|uniref:Cys-tRNA(Pro)/Cys-tRNA(Cys) deacylase n=1 Tax=Vibrio porteresiae DSM 19223 TaxID=1123496 RepID=A0ABZ0QE02_9VIBR|nr:YbaK/EbsC family protein [Vibrio porteresiae]WPC74432.1 YbaK/EbsC family protein [Vibrio porteresiae DSM 19223]